MSAAIIVSEENVWWTRRWIFEELLQDVQNHFPDDLQACHDLNQLSIVGGLRIDVYDAPYGERLARMIYTGANGILNGTVASGLVRKGYPEESVRVYRGGLEDLVELLESDGRYCHEL